MQVSDGSEGQSTESAPWVRNVGIVLACSGLVSFSVEYLFATPVYVLWTLGVLSIGAMLLVLRKAGAQPRVLLVVVALLVVTTTAYLGSLTRTTRTPRELPTLAASAEWVSLAPPESGFSIDLPSAVVDKSGTRGETPVSAYVHSGGLWSVTHYPLPPEARKYDITTLLDNAVSNSLSLLSATEVSRARLDGDGIQGAEFRARSKDRLVRGRIYIHQERVLTFVVVDEIGDRAFDSLEFSP